MKSMATRVLLALTALTFTVPSVALADRVTPSDRVVNFVNVYKSPTSTTVLGRLSPGETAPLKGDVPRWYVIDWNGVSGYVYKSATRIVPDAAAATPAAATGAGAPMRIHFIDVGQGAATLLEFPCGAALIDTGGEDNDEFDGVAALDSYLKAFFTRRGDLANTLDVIFLTHPHPDHTAGADVVRSSPYKIKNVVTNGQDHGKGVAKQEALVEWASDNQVPHVEIEAKDVPGVGLGGAVIDPINCGSIDPVLRVLWGQIDTGTGWSDSAIENENNSSLVIRLDYGKASLLVTGDLEEAAIPRFLSNANAQLVDTDIYVAGHHGSRNGTTAELVESMTPQLAVFQAGPQERDLPWTARRYGHPNKIAVDHLLGPHGVTDVRTPITVKIGVKGGTNNEWETRTITKALYSIGWDGNITITATADGTLSVDTSH